MKTCPKCGTQLNDTAIFCHSCGEKFTVSAGASAEQQPQQPQYQQPQPQYAAAPDPYDHTAEFDAKDISDNKVFAMIVYLMSIFGVLIAVIASRESKFVGFHVRQSLKISVIEILSALIMIIPIVGLIVYGVFVIIFLVIRIICFVQICKNQAKEPPIIRGFKFLK